MYTIDNSKNNMSITLYVCINNVSPLINYRKINNAVYHYQYAAELK